MKNRNKNEQSIYGKDKPRDESFKTSYISVFSHWKILETTLTTESNDLPAKLILHQASILIKNLMLFLLSSI